MSAPHKRAAHEFMNYILRPDVGGKISEFTGYGSPNQAAVAVMKNPVPYPTAEEMKRLEYQVDLGKDTATWDRIWTEIKSA
jgi:spermidine/putrescine transport system substrate-binding protein